MNDLNVEIASFDRQSMYEEIWNTSVSKAAEKYDIGYEKLKKALVEAEIPLPTQSYRTSLQYGKKVNPTPLKPSDKKDVSICVVIKECIDSRVHTEHYYRDVVPPKLWFIRIFLFCHRRKEKKYCRQLKISESRKVPLCIRCW